MERIRFMPNVAKIEALQKEIAELRKNLANIIFDIDHNIFHVSKELEKEYTEKVGHLEFKSFQTQCAILRTKRKMEIVKEIVESNRQLDLEFVEKIVAVDFEEYANMLQEQANLMKLALKQDNASDFSASHEADLACAYKNLIDRLHPEMHKKQDETANKLFQEGVAAYSKKDLEALEAVVEKSFSFINTTPATCDLALLKEVKAALEKATVEMREHQTLLSKSFPFTAKSLLHDEDQLAAKINELNEHINYYETHLKRFEEHLKEIIDKATI